MIQKKRGVKIANLHPSMWLAYGVALAVYDELRNRKNCVITSGNDGKHMEGSLHYEDRAIDLRVWGFSDARRSFARGKIARLLGKHFDVVDEGDHIHVEYDPKHAKWLIPPGKGVSGIL